MPLTTKAAFRKDIAQPHDANFQHRHYAEIARIIRGFNLDVRARVEDRFATQLRVLSSTFNEDRFRRACKEVESAS